MRHANQRRRRKYAYKLFRLRKDGTLGPLFINRRLVVPIGVWLRAESHPTKGYALRPGWHCTDKPVAPHLSLAGRIWCKVEIQGAEMFRRPVAQGGTWWLAKRLRVVRVLEAGRV